MGYIEISKAVDSQKLDEDIRFVLGKTFTTNSFEWKPLTGGATNKLYLCNINDTKYGPIKVIFKIFGQDTTIFIDRKKELEILSLLHEGGVGPKVFASFDNGLIYEFQEGREVTKDELTNGIYTTQLATMIAKWHQMTHMPGDRKSSQLFNNIKNWINEIPQTYNDPYKDSILAKFGGSDNLHKELKELQSELESLNSPIVFCHNDLFEGNFIINENTKELAFIDYEYASYNFRGQELGIFFAEWGALKYETYPSKQEQYKFFLQYFKTLYKHSPSEEELHNLYIEVYKFSLCAHFHWGIWALVQSKISDVDFDYMNYARDRLEQYFNNKDKILKMSSGNSAFDYF